MLETNKNAVTVLYSGGDIQVPFLFYDAADLVVLFDTTRKTLGTDYSVTGAGNESGGKVTLLNPPANDTRVTVLRRVDFLQLLEIPSNGIIPEGALNRALDRIVMMVQQLAEQAERAVTYPDGTAKNQVLDVANVIETVEQARDDAHTAMAAAEQSVQASQAAVVASNKAVEDAETKRVQVNQDGETQVDRILAEGNKQYSRVETEGNAQYDRVAKLGDEKTTRVRDVGDWHYQRLVTTGNENVAAIDTAHDNAVADLNSVKNSAKDEVAAMPSYVPNYQTMFHELRGKALSDKLTGKEGIWSCTHKVDVTPTSMIDYYLDGTGTCTRLIFLDGETVPVIFGLTAFITVDSYGIIQGNSGEYYRVYCSLGRAVRIDPRHGDVREDFTVGNTYKMAVFQESHAADDQLTNQRYVNEFILGGHALAFPEHVGKQVIGFSSGHTYLEARACTWRGDGSNPPAISRSDVLTIVFHHVYNPVSPVFTVGVKQDFANETSPWVNLDNVVPSYDETMHTLTWSGTLATAPWNFEEITYGLSMQGGEIVAMDGEHTVYAEITSTTYGLCSEDASFYYQGAWYTGGANEAVMYSNDASAVSLDLIEVGHQATVEPFFFEGDFRRSTLLGDCPQYGSEGEVQHRLTIRAHKSILSFDYLSVRKKNGSWIYPELGNAQLAGQYSVNGIQNWVVLNISVYAEWGYDSLEDFLENGAVGVHYNTRSRVWRPVGNPDGIVVYPELVIVPRHEAAYAAGAIIPDLTDYVPTHQSGHPITATLKGVVNDYNLGGVRYRIYYNHEHFNDIAMGSTADDKVRTAICFGMYVENGRAKMVLWFQDILWDDKVNSWGMRDWLSIKDGINTHVDLNGHRLLQGCMHYGTGINV